ncbi:jg6466 [Pararge aegeria aegeria]|uniref:Jg6466 protein n=1 Tax=Pararge aegeria aegeria TaxID=348720 RepID=A0A8S4SK99_9NEOP|nr:jg6466 [Pararge aegeria aegeria]
MNLLRIRKLIKHVCLAQESGGKGRWARSWARDYSRRTVAALPRRTPTTPDEASWTRIGKSTCPDSTLAFVNAALEIYATAVRTIA